jgi:hypothetical protein
MWRVGTSTEVTWSDDGTSVGVTISAAIPELIEATPCSCCQPTKTGSSGMIGRCSRS